MRELIYKNAFRKQYKLMKLRGKNMKNSPTYYQYIQIYMTIESRKKETSSMSGYSI